MTTDAPGNDGGPRFLVPRETVHTVRLAEPDPRWADAYAVEEARIRAAVAEALVDVQHVGSTSVPGLAAKPVIDILLVVRDSTDEGSYVPALEAERYALHVREPDWYEHRLLKRGTPHFAPGAGGATKVNLHVFSAGCEEARRMVRFRDRLRADPADRERYEQTKRALARRRWDSVQDYADAKSAVVAEIMRRAGPASAAAPPSPTAPSPGRPRSG